MAGSGGSAPTTTAETFALLTSRLAMNNEDAVLTVIGDSTGNDPWEWVYQVTRWLAKQYPAYTVQHFLWNDGTQSYGAAVKDDGAGSYTAGNVQTGTGPNTLKVYNASTPGQNAAYSVPKVAKQVPAYPHLILVSYGHNQAETTAKAYRPVHYALTRLLEDWFPQAGMVMIAQNPRAATDPGYAAGLARNQAIIDLAGSEGYGLVNVTQAFLNTPNYAATLLNPDQLHPNAAGSAVWAREVQKHLRRSTGVVPRGAAPRPHRIFVPATAFLASEGAPTLALAGPANAQTPAWAFDKDIQQGIIAAVDYPDSWDQVNFYLVWSVATGSGYTGSTVARWGVGFSRYAQATGIPFPSQPGDTLSGVPNNFTEYTANAGPLNAGAWTTMISRLVSYQNYGQITYRPLGLRVRRIAADALDQLAETAYLRGVIIERAS